MDAFMGFLVVVGVVQFAYCVLAGNYVRLRPLPTHYRACEMGRRPGRKKKRVVVGRLQNRGERGSRGQTQADSTDYQPFNAFLSGFSATVGQFVLTASLRIQTNPENRKEFESISDER